MHVSRIGRLIVGIVVTAVGFTLVGPPATAQELVHTDQTGDIAKVLRNGTFLADPGRTYPDIVRTRFAHLDDDLVVRMSFRDLRRRGELNSFSMTVRRPDGRQRFFAWFGSSEGWGGGELITNVQRPCDAEISIDYRDDMVRMVVPRTCLNDPRWVRMSAEADLTFQNGTDFFDSATRGRMTNLKVGPFTRRLLPG